MIQVCHEVIDSEIAKICDANIKFLIKGQLIHDVLLLIGFCN